LCRKETQKADLLQRQHFIADLIQKRPDKMNIFKKIKRVGVYVKNSIFAPSQKIIKP
jgi:hypothetical protein